MSRFPEIEKVHEDKASIRNVKNVLNIVAATGTTVPREIGPSGESDGTLRTALVGKDAAGNFDNLLTDDLRRLVISTEHSLVQLDPVLIADSEGAILDGSASLDASSVYDVEFEIVNITDSTTATFDLGVDIGATGSLSGAEYFMKNWSVGPGGSNQSGNLPLRRKLRIGGDDDIRAVASAANVIAVHFLAVRKVA